MGQGSVDLNVMEYYGQRETEQIKIKLDDVAQGEVIVTLQYHAAV